jgi:hypothetical protein
MVTMAPGTKMLVRREQPQVLLAAEECYVL